MAVIHQADLRLLEAAKSGTIREVQLALNQAVDPNCREIGGYRFTALHRAIYSNTSVAGVLLADLRVDPNVDDTLGHTPLHLGWRGCVPAMERSVRVRDVNWDFQDKIDQTPLLYHARLGNETSLIALLGHSELEVSMAKKTKDGFTALHQVVEQDRRFLPNWREFQSLDKRCDLVGILLEAKRRRATGRPFSNVQSEELDLQNFVNEEDFLGRSVLHYIAEEGSVAILDKLLSYFTVQAVKDGIHVDTPDVHGRAPLLLAVQRGHGDMVRKLLTFPGRQIDPTVAATVITWNPARLLPYEESHKELCRPNLSSKAPTEKYSGTPLHFAVNVSRQFQVAAALLMDKRTTELIAEDDRWEMFDKVLCLAEGPDDKTTANALLIALKGLINISNYLTKFDPNEFAVLITIAAIKNRHKIIQHILKWRPEVNANLKSKLADGHGLAATPLHFAVEGKHVDAVRALLTHPPLDANVQDSNYRTPLQIATEKKEHVMREIENLLMERPEVKEFVDRSYRDRQVFVDAANALLVGAALVASAAFASWLQPPRGYNKSVVAVEGNPTLKAFVVFNTLSFFFAIATVLACTYATVPSFKQRFIGRVVKSVTITLIVASILFSISIFCVLGAFATAGFAVLPLSIDYDWSLWGGTITLGIGCLGWLVAFYFR